MLAYSPTAERWLYPCLGAGTLRRLRRTLGLIKLREYFAYNGPPFGAGTLPQVFRRSRHRRAQPTPRALRGIFADIPVLLAANTVRLFMAHSATVLQARQGTYNGPQSYCAPLPLTA